MATVPATGLYHFGLNPLAAKWTKEAGADSQADANSFNCTRKSPMDLLMSPGSDHSGCVPALVQPVNSSLSTNTDTYPHDDLVRSYELQRQTTPTNSGKRFDLPRTSAIPNPLTDYITAFYSRRVETRRNNIAKTLREVVHIAQEILHEVELQEPRFISTLKIVHTPNQVCEENNRRNSQPTFELYDGLRVLSPTKFEVILYLNQMGVFNFVDDGSVPGGAVLKLSDGRKRSMSLWVEFITASGYLSARKIRARFYSLVNQAVQKCTYRGILRVISPASEVRICIRERYILQITPAFRCPGLWPRSAGHWPVSNHVHNSLGMTIPTIPNIQWPSPQMVNEVKREGFCLLSQESVYTKDKQASAEGDAWLLDFYDAEEYLLSGGTRKQCLNILKTLVSEHLTGIPSNSAQGNESNSVAILNPTIEEYDLKILVLHECEKHPREDEWTKDTLADRINGILLQLISCLQHRRCPHYFLPQLDIFRGRSHAGMDVTARQAWCLLRDLLTCPGALDRL
ncbi:unnamed protein product [Calicophoron daubneyi]|uniref:Mab-21 domain-containing protein n=1 Tax=Calicophoron daubneyi TaxID=300641 RepID=A0AAV2TJA2_CALDB